jgi:hypothetical protein
MTQNDGRSWAEQYGGTGLGGGRSSRSVSAAHRDHQAERAEHRASPTWRANHE